jgi:hypothetical protein
MLVSGGGERERESRRDDRERVAREIVCVWVCWCGVFCVFASSFSVVGTSSFSFLEPNSIFAGFYRYLQVF